MDAEADVIMSLETHAFAVPNATTHFCLSGGVAERR